MLRVTVQQKGVTPDQMILKLTEKVKDIEKAMFQLGKQTAEQMKEVITTNSLRHPTSDGLAGVIDAHEERLGNYTVGVGRKSVLPPYWYVLNYGKKFTGEDFIPGGGKTVMGDFAGNAPDGSYAGTPGGAGVRMSHPGTFAVTAQHAIEPVNYIEKTANWLQGYWKTYITTVAKS